MTVAVTTHGIIAGEVWELRDSDDRSVYRFDLLLREDRRRLTVIVPTRIAPSRPRRGQKVEVEGKLLHGMIPPTDDVGDYVFLHVFSGGHGQRDRHTRREVIETSG